MESQQIEKPISVGEWVLNIFIASIPLVGLIILIVWAVSSDIPESKSNWAKGMLVWYVIGIVLAFIFGASILAVLISAGGLGN